jgi:DNA-binding MarR family transcriptional regulator
MGMNDEIENALRRAAAAWRLAMERALAPLDLTPAQFAVLRMVVEAPGSSGADLARIERLTPPTMSVIIGNLERKGALTRRAHPDNARVQCLEATARGLELQARARENTLSSRARLASAAPSDACKVILAWLRSVSEIEV